MNVTEIRELEKELSLEILLLRQSTDYEAKVAPLINSFEKKVDILFKECIKSKKDLITIRQVFRNESY
ncbi:MAG: hypothetical protein ACW990_00090 [Promethearchaeota archaeon]